MEATAAKKEEFVDPVCGMTVDPGREAGTSERDGVRYYFCSAGCKAKFDAGAVPPAQLTHEPQGGGIGAREARGLSP